MKKNILAVLALLSLFSCSALGIRSGVSEDERAKVKNIAVVSLLGNQFQMVYVGATEFANNANKADVSAWKIDLSAEDSLEKALKQNSQFQKVGRLQFPANPAGAHFTNSEVIDKVQTLAAAQGYDTLVLLQPEPYSNAPLMKPGYGLHKNKNMFGSTSTSLYLLGIVAVYNTATKSRLGWQWTFDSMSGHPGMASDEKVEWKDKFSDFTPAEQKRIESALKVQIDQAVNYALHSLELLK